MNKKMKLKSNEILNVQERFSKSKRKRKGTRKNLKEKKKEQCSLKKILLGSKDVAKNFDLLQENGIVAVLNLTENMKNYHEDSTTLFYKRISISDSGESPIERFFLESIQFIEHHLQNGKVLVHCKEGLSRSPTMVIAFAMKYFGITLKEAYKKIIEKVGLNININDGFKQQLMNWDLQLNFCQSYDFFSRSRISLSGDSPRKSSPEKKSPKEFPENPKNKISKTKHKRQRRTESPKQSAEKMDQSETEHVAMESAGKMDQSEPEHV